MQKEICTTCGALTERLHRIELTSYQYTTEGREHKRLAEFTGGGLCADCAWLLVGWVRSQWEYRQSHPNTPPVRQTLPKP